MIGSPLNLKLLLHCYYSAGEPEGIDNAVVQEGIKMLLDTGMIEPVAPVGQEYSTTSKGEFYVEHLLSIPFPRSHWTIPHKEQAP